MRTIDLHLFGQAEARTANSTSYVKQLIESSNVIFYFLI